MTRQTNMGEKLLAEWGAIVAVAKTVRQRVRHAFPERQILIRDHGRVRCFTLGTVQQLAITAVIAGCVLWALLATAAYVDTSVTLAAREDDLSRQVTEINGIKANYQAAFGRLDEFQTIFSSITCEVSDIQDSLTRIAEHSGPPAAPVKKGAAPINALPRLDPQAGSGCRTIAQAKPPAETAMMAGDTKRIVGAIATTPEQEAVRQHVVELEQNLEKLKASHGAFLEHSAGLTAMRFGELERTLAKVGIDAQSLLSEADRQARAPTPLPADPRYGQGGPFIAAPVAGPMVVDSSSPVALFNSHAERLETLSQALLNLPLAEPLADYEITSPFGVRNDPINTMSGIHEGVDMGAATGTPILVTGNGKVVSAGWRDRYGYMIEVDHGMGLHTRYGHLSKILVSAGDTVRRGMPIGLLGDTGRTTGPHLHYEVRVEDQATNPMKFIMAGRDVLKVQ
jgi:murein DD-endopeptidase MepM/ murein hydrolase activator NlpD